MLRAPDAFEIDTGEREADPTCKSRKHEMEEAHVWPRVLCARTIDMPAPNQEGQGVRQVFFPS